MSGSVSLWLRDSGFTVVWGGAVWGLRTVGSTWTGVGAGNRSVPSRRHPMKEGLGGGRKARTILKKQVPHIFWKVVGCCLLGSLSTTYLSPSAFVPRSPFQAPPLLSAAAPFLLPYPLTPQSPGIPAAPRTPVTLYSGAVKWKRL